MKFKYWLMIGFFVLLGISLVSILTHPSSITIIDLPPIKLDPIVMP